MLFIATFWALLVLSCLRPIHLQRSSISILPERIKGHVSFGKAKTRGRRKPFYWSCGRTFFGGIDVGRILKAVLEKTGMGTSSSRGIMPDLLPQRAQLAKISGFKSQPMALSRLSNLSPSMFAAAGAEQNDIDITEGLYAPRHVLPSIGDALNIDEKKWLPLGAWASKEKSKLAMPNLYSSAKLWREARDKHRLIMACDAALIVYETQHQGAQPMSWEPLYSALPSFKFTLARAADGSFISGPRTLCEDIEDEPVLGDVPISQLVHARGSSDNSSGSSSADSNGSGMEEDPLVVFVDLAWQLSKGRAGMLHLVNGVDSSHL